MADENEQNEQNKPTFFDRMYVKIGNGMEKVGKGMENIYKSKYFWPVIGTGALVTLISVTSCYNHKKIETLSQQVANGDSTLSRKLDNLKDISTENQDSLYKIGNGIYSLQDSAHVIHNGVIGVGKRVRGLDGKLNSLSGDIKSQHKNQAISADSTYGLIAAEFDEVDQSIADLQGMTTVLAESTRSINNSVKKIQSQTNKPKRWYNPFSWGR